MVRPEAVITASSDVIVCDLDSAKALLDLKSGCYFSLNPSASQAWAFLSEPKTYAQLSDAMFAHFDVDAQVLAADLERLITDLQSRGLITVG